MDKMNDSDIDNIINEIKKTFTERPTLREIDFVVMNYGVRNREQRDIICFEIADKIANDFN